MKRSVVLAVGGLVALSLASVACGKAAPPPPQAVIVPPPQEDPSPPLSAEDQVAFDADWAAARQFVEQGKSLDAQGDAAHKAKSGSGAEAWTRAAQCYGTAYGRMQKWIEPSAGKVTEFQLEHRLRPIAKEVESWADPFAAIIGEDRRAGANKPSAPRAITAFLVGLKSRAAALSMQRAVNEYAGEPLTAVLPGLALQEVWEITGAVEKTLFAVSALVVIVGLAGMLVALLTSLSERRREMAVLRSVGARPAHVFALILGEAAFLTALGVVLGVSALYVGLLAGQPWLESRLGLFIAVSWPSAYELLLIVLVGLAGVLIGLMPAYRCYRYSLADGMTIRI